MSMEKMSPEEIEEEMKDFLLWNLENNTIVRELVASNFSAALGIVFSIGVLAETMDHHPDILLYGWNKVRVTLSTHSLGGLTANDFKLAKKIDDLNL